MMSNQALKVLAAKFSSYRQGFIEANPGCNENDVEREFLHLCPSWEKTEEARAERAKINDLIERIR